MNNELMRKKIVCCGKALNFFYIYCKLITINIDD